MSREYLDIKAIEVDLLKRQISINGQELVLKVRRGREQCAFMAYAAAFATKCRPMSPDLIGFTWEWLTAIDNTATIAGLNNWGFSDERHFVQVWNQRCKSADSWHILQKPSGLPDWHQHGNRVLEHLFLSKLLTSEERQVIDAKKGTKRRFFPATADITLVPDGNDFSELLASVPGPLDEKVDSTGNVLGDSIDAGVRATFVTNVPPLPPLIIGRQEAFDRLKQFLRTDDRTFAQDQSPPLVVMRGWPGVGKSTVAVALGHDLAVQNRFSDGVLWTSLGQQPSLVTELAGWGRVVGDANLAATSELTVISSRVRSLLHHKRMLLIVDDVWEAQHLAAFAVAGPGCATLVTTRLPVVAQALASTSDEMYVLPVLPDEYGMELLTRLAPDIVAARPEKSLEVVRVLEGLPLALQVAGHLLNVEQTMGWGVDELLVELQDEARILEAQAPPDCADLISQSSPTVAALLRKSTDRLDDHTRECFAKLGPFAAKPATFDTDAMAYVWETKDPRPAIRELVGRGLLEAVGDGRFQMHALLVAHAKSLLPG